MVDHVKDKRISCSIYDYIMSARGVGHTTLLKEGASNYKSKFFVVGADMKHAQQLARELKNPNAIPVDYLTYDRLNGCQYPVIIDNHAFTTMYEKFNGAIDKVAIENLEWNIRYNLDMRKMRAKKGKLENISLWGRIFNYEKTCAKINNDVEKLL